MQSKAKKKSRIAFVSQLRIAIRLIGPIFVCSPNLAKTATSHIAKYPLPTILTETYWPGIGTLHSAVQTSPSASCRTWSPHIGFCLWSFRIPTRTSKFDNGLEKLPEKKVIYERREVLAVQQAQEDIFDIEILRWKSSRTGDCKQHVAICALVCSICSHFVTKDFRVAPGWKAFLDFFAGFVLMANHRECVGQGCYSASFSLDTDLQATEKVQKWACYFAWRQSKVITNKPLNAHQSFI